MHVSDPLRGSIDLIRRHARLFETDRQAVIATTLHGEIVYWSRAAERLYGWSREEVQGHQILDITPSAVSRERASMIMSMLQQGRSWSGMFEVRTKSGSEFTAYVRDIPVRDHKGELLGIVGVSAVVEQDAESLSDGDMPKETVAPAV